MSKVDDLQKKYPGIAVKALANADPSPTKKYLAWSIKQVKAGYGPDYVSTMTQLFHTSLPRLLKKDINAYATVDDVNKALGAAAYKAKDTVKVYEDMTQVVVRPDTKEATKQFGRDTDWCITQTSKTYYEDYLDENAVFYYILNKTREKTDPLSKVAVAVTRTYRNHIDKVLVYDSEDECLSNENRRNIKFIDKVLQICKEDAVKRPIGVLSKLFLGTATLEEIDELYKRAKKTWDSDSNTSLLVALAESKKTPVKILSELADHHSNCVRQSLAHNIHTPGVVLAHLAKDVNLTVRSTVIDNPSTPDAVLDLMRAETDTGVNFVSRIQLVLSARKAKKVSKLTRKPSVKA